MHRAVADRDWEQNGRCVAGRWETSTKASTVREEGSVQKRQGRQKRTNIRNVWESGSALSSAEHGRKMGACRDVSMGCDTVCGWGMAYWSRRKKCMENGEVLVYYVLMTDRGAQEGNLFLSAPLNNAYLLERIQELKEQADGREVIIRNIIYLR